MLLISACHTPRYMPTPPKRTVMKTENERLRKKNTAPKKEDNIITRMTWMTQMKHDYSSMVIFLKSFSCKSLMLELLSCIWYFSVSNRQRFALTDLWIIYKKISARESCICFIIVFKCNCMSILSRFRAGLTCWHKFAFS